MKRTKKIISNSITVILFLILAFMIFVVISSKASGGEPQFLGYQLKTVLSGSMEPTFKTGSIILTKKIDDIKQLKKNDVITFQQDEKNLVTHRIIEVMSQDEKVMFRTKGDNNEEADMNPVIQENVVAKYSGITIPFIGYFMKFAKSPIGTAILLILPGLLLLGYAAFTIRSAIKEIEGKPKGIQTNEPKEEIV